MLKLNFEKTTIEVLKDWESILELSYTNRQYKFPDPEDVPDNLKLIFEKLHAEIKEKGIDPSTIYPVCIETNQNSDKLQTTIVFNYEAKTNA